MIHVNSLVLKNKKQTKNEKGTYERSVGLSACLLSAADAFFQLEDIRRRVHVQVDESLMSPLRFFVTETLPQAKRVKDEHKSVRLRTSRSQGGQPIHKEQYKISCAKIDHSLRKFHERRREILHTGVHETCAAELNSGSEIAAILKCVWSFFAPNNFNNSPLFMHSGLWNSRSSHMRDSPQEQSLHFL